mmetsp:Transcript_5335/g.7866  ORF Transcript_5335/g.7866 Transcript_5335/m.7866 type:complete len:180 (-) Transcript_5335:3816-4355(-)
MKIGDVDLRALLNSDAQEERSWQVDVEDDLCSFLPSLTFQERVVGCLFCMMSGYLLSLGSWFRFKRLLLGDPWPFVCVSTIGNIVSLSGSCFLSGPRTQVNKMFHETRRTSSIVYLFSIGLTLVVAFFCLGFKWQAPVMIVLMLCQYVAVTWYCLSYIPFARDTIRNYIIRRWRELVDE